jgi:hypothetical protein
MAKVSCGGKSIVTASQRGTIQAAAPRWIAVPAR